jgi:hypothetical protein
MIEAKLAFLISGGTGSGNPGVYPKPFGGMGKPLNQNGFSDRYPIAMTVTEVD